jgi:DNA-binding NtrC family response regulator
MSKILIVDDEKAILNTLKEILEFEGYTIKTAGSGEEGLEMLQNEAFNVCLCDIKMGAMDGLSVLNQAQEVGIDTTFIMLSAHGTIETAVEATKLGAFDFLEKPPDLNRILITIKNALDNSNLKKETKRLKKKVVGVDGGIIGESTAIKELKEVIEKVGPTEARALIMGANGSGKELVAKALHDSSNRAKQAFVEVNCAAIPSELIESELFGHEKGSFTSAIKQRIGKFELANDGTLFLDEIGDMSLSAQAKVLRALQENKITRVGGEKNINVSPRIIAATNKDLKKEIQEGNFREDLYHRISVVLIKVAPLKDRRDDIPLLVDHFREEVANSYGEQAKEIDKEALKFLQGLEWTGNVRELRNVVERLVIMSGEKIDLTVAKKYSV